MNNIEIVDRDAAEIGDLYRRSKSSIVDSVGYLVYAGHRLLTKKKQLGHGKWLEWLDANATVLGFETPRTAQKLIRAAQKYDSGVVFDHEDAIAMSRVIWGSVASPGLPSPNREPLDDGCTVEDLNDLITAGKKFSVTYADPPWEFKVYSGKGKKRSAERHYETSSLEDIKQLPI
jgi:hypothetical protein